MLAEAGFAFPLAGGMGEPRAAKAGARIVEEEIARAGALGPPGGVGQMTGPDPHRARGPTRQRVAWVPALAAGAES